MAQDYRNLSYWHDSVPGTLAPRPPLDRDIDVDVVIAGAGYTGLWTAYFLKQLEPSLEVAILESEIAGFGASGRNGGWCSAFLSGIDYWLEDSEHREGAIRLQRLMFGAVPEIGRIAERESIDCHFEQSGALEIAVIPPQLDRLREELEYYRALGFGEEDYRWLDGSELSNLLNVDRAQAAIHMRHCAAIHPSRLARGLAGAVERLGVTIYERSPVLGTGDQSLLTPGGRVRAETVLLATEGYSDSVAGRQRRLIPVHSMMVVTEPLNDAQLDAIRFQRRFCFANLDRMVTYGQLTPDKRIAFGCRGGYRYGSRFRTFHAGDPEFKLVAGTLMRFFPGLEGVRFTHGWGGAMGVSRSLRPSVNFSPTNRVGWAGGFFGNGVGATHLAGRTLAELVTGQETERTRTPWVNPQDPHRKWEPEPFRWLGFKTCEHLMQLADRAEYRGSPLAPAIARTLDTLFP